MDPVDRNPQPSCFGAIGRGIKNGLKTIGRKLGCVSEPRVVAPEVVANALLAQLDIDKSAFDRELQSFNNISLKDSKHINLYKNILAQNLVNLDENDSSSSDDATDINLTAIAKKAFKYHLNNINGNDDDSESTSSDADLDVTNNAEVESFTEQLYTMISSKFKLTPQQHTILYNTSLEVFRNRRKIEGDI